MKVMTLRTCKICSKEYFSSNTKQSKTCSLECRKHYNNLYGKNDLLQRNKENKLLCYNCLQYKNDEEFLNDGKNRCSSELRNGKITNCNTCNRSKANSRYKSNSETIDGILKNRILNAKYTSKKRNIYFDKNLTIEYIKNIYNNQEGRCALSGEILEIGEWKERTISIDRIDSSKGYEIDNIQLVCWIINHMKVNLDQNEFIDWCIKVSEKQLIENL